MPYFHRYRVAVTVPLRSRIRRVVVAISLSSYRHRDVVNVAPLPSLSYGRRLSVVVVSLSRVTAANIK